MPRFLSCLSGPEDTGSKKRDEAGRGLIDENNERIEGCPFCDVSVEKGFGLIFESPELIAFEDRSPQSETHLLIIPRNHISTVKQLNRDHIPLLQRMVSLADELVPNHRKLGFHIPPFSSVHHLHLHVLAGRPTLLGRFKYPERGDERKKGWSWFITPQQAINILDRGDRISLKKSRA